MEILNTSAKAESRLARDIGLPAAIMLGIIALDHYILPGAVITPTCNFLAMGLLALYLPPRTMVFWACCFTFSSVYMLHHPNFSQGMVDKKLTADVRSIGAFVGAGVAIMLCANRFKVSRSHAQLVALVKRLPVPFVLSDKNGTLLYISEDAARLLNISQKDAEGQSYFALLLNLSEKGAAIQRYVTLLDAPENQESVIELKLVNCPGKSWNGMLMPVDLQIGRCLITVITPALKSAAEPASAPAAVT